MADIQQFGDISDAFDYCREADRPVKVLVQGVKYKLYPSGYSQLLTNLTLRGQRVLAEHAEQVKEPGSVARDLRDLFG